MMCALSGMGKTMSVVLREKQVLIKVQTLGGFQVLVEGAPVLKRLERSRQVLNLLAYLLIARFDVISQERLIEVLWADENSDDPVNALKNLAYRLRKILSSHDTLSKSECIMMKNGTYAWNTQVSCSIDCEEMENLCKRVSDTNLSIDQRINLYKEALSLYKGRFLPDSSSELWVIPLSSYYQTLYMNCVREAVALLTLQHRYDEVSSICESAIALEPYEEVLHECLLKALINLDKKSKALEHYHAISNKFYKDLGVKLCAPIRGLYKELISDLNKNEADISTIKGDMLDSQQAGGAFFCEYEIFKHFYRLESRSAERAGQSVFICLITLSSVPGVVQQKNVLISAMDKLKDVIVSSLRRGDVASRFCSSQYILMLPTATYENGEMVVERILSRFKKEYKTSSVRVSATLEPIVSIM